MSENPIQEKQENQQARRYRVSGRVQGVGFRYFASRLARGLGLTGYEPKFAHGFTIERDNLDV